MKNTLCSFLYLFLVFVTNAQPPQGIPYQAIARNSAGNIIVSQPIRVRFTIHDSIATGTIVYRETFTPTTNPLGLFNVNVGMGIVVSGTFSGINWGHNSKFMQVEMDPTGGTSYVDMGTTQMMSVPYALYAKNTETLGAQVLLYKNAFSAVNSIIVDSNYINSKYDSYVIELTNVTSTTNTHLYMQVSTNNGASYLTGSSFYDGSELSNSTIAVGAYGMNSGQIDLMLATGALSTVSGYSYYLNATLANVNFSNSKMFTGRTIYHQATGGYLDQQFLEASINISSSINAFVIHATTGSISGILKIYGVN